MENVWLTGCVSAQESHDLPQWKGVCLTEIRLPPSGTILIRKRLGSWRPLVLSHRQGWCFPSWCCWTFSKPWPQHTRGLRLFQGFGYNLQWSGQCCHFSRQLSPTMSSSTTAPRFSQFSGWTLCLLFFFFPFIWKSPKTALLLEATHPQGWIPSSHQPSAILSCPRWTYWCLIFWLDIRAMTLTCEMEHWPPLPSSSFSGRAKPLFHFFQWILSEHKPWASYFPSSWGT